MKQQIGFKYIDHYHTEQVVWDIIHYNDGDYYVTNEPEIVYDPEYSDRRPFGELVNEDEMDKLISKQSYLKEEMEKAKKLDEVIQEKEKKEEEEQRNKEYLFGFDANLTPIQRGKVLKTLMSPTSFRYYDTNRYFTTRKDLILYLLSIGFIPEKREETTQRKATCFHQNFRPTTVIEKSTKTTFLMRRANETVDVLKTEYQFAKYMYEKEK